MSESPEFGPHLFQPDVIDAETAAFNSQLEALLAGVPAPQDRPPQVTRDEREAGRGIFGPIVRSESATQRTIPGPGGALPLRIIRPERVRGVYLHLHGGGWVLGRPHHYDVMLEALARAAGLATVSVDYRLAPEQPYPAAPDDCEAAALWLVEQARAEFGAGTLLIGGESAGAHLSVVTLLRLRDRHGLAPFRAANLTYGVYDLSMTPSARRWGPRYLVLNTPSMEWFADQFVPAGRRHDPDVSPLNADLRGLPPALFSVGTLDPLLDDSLFMYGRWVAAGNRAELAVYPGGPHGFTGYPTALGRRAAVRINTFLADAVGG